MSKSPTCIYIASRGHSGSTILEVLLARHRKIAAAGEVANLGLQCVRQASTSWSGQCGCGLSPFECPVWSEVMDRIQMQTGIDMRTNPFDFPVSDIGREEEIQGKGFRNAPINWLRKKYWRALRHQQYDGWPVVSTLASLHKPQKRWAENRALVLRALADIQGASAVVDSSKDALGMRDMHDYSDMDIKILFLTRDCRGNAWSFVKRSGAEGSGRTEALSYASKEWLKINRRIERLLVDVPRANWKHVKYEELCREPREVLTDILEFAGLEYDEAVLDGREDVAHTIAGNRIRLSNTSAKIQEDQRWREHFTEKDEQAVRDVAGEFSRRLGYEL